MKGNLQLNIKTYLKGLMLLGVMLTFVACQDKDEFTPDPVSGDINDFYEDAQGSFGTEIFNAASEFVYITNNNTSVHIPANSFIYPDGSEVTGLVTITFEDVLNRGEHVIHNIPTKSNDELINTRGTVFVGFSQDGVELSVIPGNLLTIRISDASADSDNLLYDGFDGTSLDWNISNESMSIESWSFFWDGKDWIDSGYEIYISSTGWYTVAKTINTSVATQDIICSKLPAELYNGSNSDVFLIFDDYDTVIPLEMDSENLLFCATFSNIPSEAEVTVVSISSLGEVNYHFGMSHAIINEETGDITVFPESQSKEQILDLLGMF